MEFDPVGLCIAAIAITVSVFVPRYLTYAAFGCLAFASTAVVSLSSMGGASITVPQISLLLFLPVALLRRGAIPRMRIALGQNAAPQLMLIFTVWAVLGAAFLPRLFDWNTEVFSLSRFDEDLTQTLQLRPSSGNVTQSLYLVGDVAAFFVPIMMVRGSHDIRPFGAGIKLLIAIQAAFALADLVGKYAFGADVLAFLRTANYTILSDIDANGIWRLSGVYVEASYFAIAVAAQLAFCIALWRGGDKFFAPAMCLLLTVFLILSTSSTGYMFLVLALSWYCLDLICGYAGGRIDRRTLVLALLITLCLAVVAVVALAAGAEVLGDKVISLINESVFNKMRTDSGMERANWNQSAINNIFDTFGLGTGLGSSRTSSWLLALLSQTGVAGFALFGAFLVMLVLPRTRQRELVSGSFAALVGACRAYIVAAVVVASISWNLVDLGILFYLNAGLCVSLTLRHQRLSKRAGAAWPSGLVAEGSHRMQVVPGELYR